MRYATNDRALKPSTLRGYRSIIGAHLLPAFGRSRPRRSAWRVMSCLSSAFRCAVDPTAVHLERTAYLISAEPDPEVFLAATAVEGTYSISFRYDK
jgi:hypothetical protein